MASLCEVCGGDGGQRARDGLPGEAQLGRGGSGLQGQGEEAGYSPAGTGQAVKGSEQMVTFGGSRGKTSGELLWMPSGGGRRAGGDHIDFSDKPDSDGQETHLHLKFPL